LDKSVPEGIMHPPDAVTDADLPVLFRDLDATSQKAQKSYLRLVKADLLFLVAGAAASSVMLSWRAGQMIINALGAVCLFAGLLLTIIIERRNLERTWYGARAAAESVKSLSWKYMMRARPFGDGDSAAGKELTKALLDILHNRRELALRPSLVANATDQITARMQCVRQTGNADRLNLYLRERIQDQTEWYRGKAAQNASKERLWFALVIALQAIALAAAIVQVFWPQIPVNAASVLAAAASSGLAWLQVKSYQELSQSYTLTAHELGLIAAAAPPPGSEDELSTFVNDAEAAISREHTMWVARREGAH
jgi:hypothetical protein